MSEKRINPTQDSAGEKETMYLVIKDHQASYPDPIVMHAGETLEVSGKEDQWNGNPDWTFIWCTNEQGKSGWVPKTYVELAGVTGKARHDYNAIELSVTVGEKVVAGQEESGWVWCTNMHGKSGWVPIENIKQE
ncbi:MAG TPA: SH3 domain-containing protein [Ktedonobacteraceae bacterium]|nr:SH3 domain-containing protein [Ktedonobacteraceae bacterium]